MESRPDLVSLAAVRAEPARDERTSPPWWTEADQAELEALVWALVDGIDEHRPQCASCAAHYPPCPHIRTAIEVVADWLRKRELLSEARWLRLEREALEIRRERALLR